MRQKDIQVTIALSGSISGDIDVRGGQLSAIYVPVITSGDLLFLGSFDVASGPFVRIRDTRAIGSGDLRIATGAGSCMVLWPDSLRTPSFVRLETSVPQAAAVQLTLRYSSAP